jgi:hypothetical protein
MLGLCLIKHFLPDVVSTWDSSRVVANLGNTLIQQFWACEIVSQIIYRVR